MGEVSVKTKQVIYYHDELTDEFSTAQIKARKIDENYCYDNNTLAGKAAHIFWYRILARPLAWVYLKVAYCHKIVNKKALKKEKGHGFFLYGNHTHPVADAFMPSMVSYPVDTYVIVHPNNVSMPVLGRVTPSLGAIPLPDDVGAAKNFVKVVKARIAEGKCVAIYPEAHIWPYYTEIRPFPDTSFRYPVQCGVPVYCFTDTYQKRRFSSRPRIVTYVDGPFYPDAHRTAKEQKEQLRQEVYATMKLRSENNSVERIKYIKSGETND